MTKCRDGRPSHVAKRRGGGRVPGLALMLPAEGVVVRTKLIAALQAGAVDAHAPPRCPFVGDRGGHQGRRRRRLGWRVAKLPRRAVVVGHGGLRGVGQWEAHNPVKGSLVVVTESIKPAYIDGMNSAVRQFQQPQTEQSQQNGEHPTVHRPGATGTGRGVYFPAQSERLIQ